MLKTICLLAAQGLLALALSLFFLTSPLARGALDPTKTPDQNFDLSRLKLESPINLFGIRKISTPQRAVTGAASLDPPS